MSFPRYPKYKDSGIAWLGKVPEHWALPPLYLRYEAVLGKMLDEKRLTRKYLLPYIRNVDVQWDRVNVDQLPELDIEPEELERFTLKYGDILICEGGEVGRTAIWRGELEQCAFQKAIHRLRPTSKSEDPRFFFYCMTFAAATGVFDAEGNPNTIPHLTGEKLRRYRLPTPPLVEQIRIAEFLDRETAKIDALVEEQRRLIELLKEKRQAVISHAVTKGLDPDAPMKPSGIEWLGDVPEHWKIASVRRFVQRIEQGWSPECIGRPAEPDEWGVVKSGCVNGGVYVEQENKGLPVTLVPIPEFEIRPGDVLMSRASGSPELVGSTAYITATRPKLMLSDKIFRIHLEPVTDGEFFVLLFNAQVMRSQIERAISGAEGLANNLPQSALKGFFCVIPPIAEQLAIVRYLTAQCSLFNALIAEAEGAIDLLQERRTALISAAVTGKIDVRGLASSESDPESEAA